MQQIRSMDLPHQSRRLDAEPMREDSEVAFGSLDRPRYFHVPDEGLEAFLRMLADRDRDVLDLQ
jgi:hypothetical protein